jgi:MFS family permease
VSSKRSSVAHPVVWTILYLPFGAMSGFVSVALTFLATQNGLSITEASLLNGAQFISQWLKWTWAPAIDVTLGPKRWYLIGTVASALGVFVMSAMRMSEETLPALLAVIAFASLLNSIVGMAIESIMAATTPPAEVGRTSAWFQAGNLGGAGLGGGLGLTLLEVLPATWMAGAILGVAFVACGLALVFVPDAPGHRVAGGAVAAVRGVFGDLRAVARTKGGLLSAILCFLPLGTGAAQGILTQSTVAAHWHATSVHVAWTQGYTSGVVTALGCFVGGWLCDRMHPRSAYAVIGVALAGIAVGMALSPATVTSYVIWNLVYALGVGLAYAAFTAVVLSAIGAKSGATKYNLFASLSNFPIWWLGLVLGRVADLGGPAAMLYAEAALGVVAVGLFFGAVRVVGRTRLPETLVEEDLAAAG